MSRKRISNYRLLLDVKHLLSRLIGLENDMHKRYDVIINRIATQELELAALSSNKNLEPWASANLRDTVNSHRSTLARLSGDRAKMARRLSALEKRVKGRKKTRGASPR